MHGSMIELKSMQKARNLWLAALCVGGALLCTDSYARDKDDDGDWKHRDRGWHEHRHDDDRRDHRRHYDRHSHARDSHWDRRDHGRHYYRPDWHYYKGRYWAPPRYRGRYCEDRRHYHAVHYHVAARDYYDYYYPRYRYYGPRPYGVNASVIITLPLF